MSFGIRCWNQNGKVIFDSEFLSFRVIDIIPLYVGMIQHSLHVSAPKSRSNHVAIVQARTSYGKNTVEAYLGYSPPIVTPYDGYIVLSPSLIPSSYYKAGRMDCNVDVILVAMS